MIVYPNTDNSQEDVYDIAYRWGWQTPELRELVYLCYKTPDLADNAHRFYEGEEFQALVKLLSELGKEPDNAIKALDFGCGNGVASYSLARAGYSVIGADLSLGEIAGINAARRLQGLDGVQFDLMHSTGEKIDFEEKSFDIILLREVLHHIKELPAFMSEVRRMLKQNGLICCLRDIVIWNEDQRKHFFASHPFYPITHDEGCYYLDEYLYAFESAGLIMERTFNPVSTVINTYPANFDSSRVFSVEEAKAQRSGNYLYSFVARRV
jgi:SAM-dependent methyltransferase